RAGAGARRRDRDGPGNGDGIRRHHRPVPDTGRGHDRRGRTPQRMSALAWLLPAVPIATGVLLLTGRFTLGRRTDKAAPAIAVTAAFVALGLAIAAAVARPVVTFPL